ncbi:MAG: PEP-CTERM sorting domain-containing protein [Spirulina sp. SIO3F2]|nr:PEP-CTERM sorting domain-containing protein [Spirulina sp. SIO3F2]
MKFSASAKMLAAACSAALTTVGLGAIAPEANAFTLNTSGDWSNPVGGHSFDYNYNGMKGESQTGEEQIRWGTPASGYVTAGKSGLGFKGVSGLNIGVDQVFQIGTLSHHNYTIWSGGAPDQADMSIDLDFAGLGTKSFDYTMMIDETLNQQAVCPYTTTTNYGCSDKITWENAIPGQSFWYEDSHYTLELVGFSNNYGSGLVDSLVSQEGQTTGANLYAKITKAPDAATPEPFSMIGAGLALGAGALLKNRKK